MWFQIEIAVPEKKAMNLDDVFFSYIIRCGVEPSEFHERKRRRLKLLEDHVKVLLKRFRLSSHTVALHGPGLRSLQMY